MDADMTDASSSAAYAGERTRVLAAAEMPEVMPADASGPRGARSDLPPVSIAAHPRARRLVRTARETAGLVGFLLAAWVSLATHALPDALLRALVAGFACQLVVWAAATLLCRHLITAELRSREQALLQALAARREAGEAGHQAGPQAMRATRP
jgi:hypothetical protein